MRRVVRLVSDLVAVRMGHEVDAAVEPDGAREVAGPHPPEGDALGPRGGPVHGSGEGILDRLQQGPTGGLDEEVEASGLARGPRGPGPGGQRIDPVGVAARGNRRTAKTVGREVEGHCRPPEGLLLRRPLGRRLGGARRSEPVPLRGVRQVRGSDGRWDRGPTRRRLPLRSDPPPFDRDRQRGQGPVAGTEDPLVGPATRLLVAGAVDDEPGRAARTVATGPLPGDQPAPPVPDPEPESHRCRPLLDEPEDPLDEGRVAERPDPVLVEDGNPAASYRGESTRGRSSHHLEVRAGLRPDLGNPARGNDAQGRGPRPLDRDQSLGIEELAVQLAHLAKEQTPGLADAVRPGEPPPAPTDG